MKKPSTRPRVSFAHRAAKLGVTTALALSAMPAANAFEFGEKDRNAGLVGRFDTTISYGSAWRAQGRDPNLVGKSNGGGALSVNGDDGDLNYEPGAQVASALKATHELELAYQNWRFFGRASYFYDFLNAKKKELSPEANHLSGHDFKLLDAYVSGNFEPIEGRSTQIRAGNQVVSWGEGTFIPNGINVTNAVDLAKVRIAGSELKEALTPSPMVWASQEISDNLRVEALNILRFRKVELDPAGTFFSTNDVIAPGGSFLYAGGGVRFDQHHALVAYNPLVAGNPGQLGASRLNDINARNGGEFGLALRAFLPEWNNSELGVYYLNYHSRTPIISARRGGAIAPGGNVLGCSGATPYINAPGLLGLPGGLCNSVAAGYMAEYPEDISLFGLSFNTAGPWGMAVQGEYSYRPNMPLQLNILDLINAAAGLGNFITGTSASGAAAVPLGTYIRGYDRVEMHQFQLGVSKAFGPTWGANQFMTVGEIGYTYLNLPNGRWYGGPNYAPGANVALSPGAVADGKGAMTRASWGYRLRASLEYTNLIDNVTVTPNVAFSHDVMGYGPTFMSGIKSATLGLAFSYRDRWKANLSYTNYFGGHDVGDGSFVNPMRDRDFVEASLSYSF